MLIEVNTNPDISISSPFLSKLIPGMIDNAFKIALDPIFPPPFSNYQRKLSFIDDGVENNRFTLIYDSNHDF